MSDPLFWLLWAPLTGIVLIETTTRFWLTRLVLREVVRAFVVMELTVVRVIRWAYPPRYVLTGGCHRRGVCCTLIVGDPPRFVKDRPFLLGLFAAYHRVLHNFHVRDRGENDELIFRCGHLRDDGRCGIYRYRPFICRNYPVVTWFEPPRPMPGCGFGVAPMVVARMKSRPSLRVLNAQVAVHHPSPDGGSRREEHPDDYRRVDIGA